MFPGFFCFESGKFNLLIRKGRPSSLLNGNCFEKDMILRKYENDAVNQVNLLCHVQVHVVGKFGFEFEIPVPKQTLL